MAKRHETEADLLVERPTVQGLVHGRRAEVDRFFGIPYAAPPVGAARFAAPRPPQPWRGVRSAVERGPSAPHKIRPFPAIDVAPLVGDGGERGDDYLTLNIWAPIEAVRAPVMLFIHGGGFIVGSKDAPVHDGSAFARDGVICVAINYRLGIEGFLPLDGAPTNLGLRDMIAALQWVRDNIAGFGGDPANVTVFGESAGAMAVADLMTSPAAVGLFKRAIVQSGHGSMVRDPSVAKRLVRRLAKILKVPPTASGFRAVDWEQGWAAIEKASKPLFGVDLRDANGLDPVYGISRFVPVLGDDILPIPPLAALEGGAARDVDLLIGTNAEEMNLYFVPTRVRDKIPGFLARWMLGRSHPRAKAALKAYGFGLKDKRPGAAMTEAMHDLVFRWPARQFAERHQGRTHVYEFDWHSPACDGALGASHGMELPFVFDTLDVASGPNGLCGTNPPQELADRIHRIWVDFARDGSLPWPEFDRDGRLVHRLAANITAHEPVMPAADFLPR
jgi:para-nitrobenzyl esterase